MVVTLLKVRGDSAPKLEYKLVVTLPKVVVSLPAKLVIIGINYDLASNYVRNWYGTTARSTPPAPSTGKEGRTFIDRGKAYNIC